MSNEISKQDLEHLAELARIELDPAEEDGLVRDLRKILGYFEELQKLDTQTVRPMSGGTRLVNVFREDTSRTNTNQGKGKGSFPRSRKGFLEVPAVFE